MLDVLVISHEPATAAVVKLLCKGAGLAFTWARTGHEGLAASAEAVYDRVVVDAQLPCMDPFLLAFLHNEVAGRVIGLSETSKDERAFRDVGVKRVVGKPLVADAMFRALAVPPDPNPVGGQREPVGRNILRVMFLRI